MGCLMVLAYSLTGVFLWGLDRYAGVRLWNVWNGLQAGLAMGSEPHRLILQALPFPLFLLFVRALPLVQYHAAEHQAVHAMERGEPLDPEIVRRMPRVHPRCGTNIMAGGMVFLIVFIARPALTSN